MRRKKEQDYLKEEQQNSKLCSISQYRCPLDLLQHQRVYEVFDSVKASPDVLVCGKECDRQPVLGDLCQMPSGTAINWWKIDRRRCILGIFVWMQSVVTSHTTNTMYGRYYFCLINSDRLCLSLSLSSATDLWISEEEFNNIQYGTAWIKIHTVPLILSTGETVSADRLHSDAEPGLFLQRRFRLKYHRYIKTAPFTDLNTCSKAEGNGVILKLYYLLFYYYYYYLLF